MCCATGVWMEGSVMHLVRSSLKPHSNSNAVQPVASLVQKVYSDFNNGVFLIKNF